jgi:hypothetical protein
VRAACCSTTVVSAKGVAPAGSKSRIWACSSLMEWATAVPGRRHHLTEGVEDRRGRSEDRRRLRQYTSTVGWNPSWCSRGPQAAFQAMSRRSALIASRSDRPSRACNTITLPITSAGTDGCPPPGGRHRRTAQAGTGAGGGRRERRTPTRQGPGDGTRSPRPAGHRKGTVASGDQHPWRPPLGG